MSAFFFLFVPPIRALIDLFVAIPVFRLKLSFFERQIVMVSHKVMRSALGHLESCEHLPHCSITCSKAADGFSSMQSRIGFLRRSLRRHGRPIFQHFSKILSGSLSYCFSHLCVVRAWISSCFQLQKRSDTLQTIA